MPDAVLPIYKGPMLVNGAAGALVDIGGRRIYMTTAGEGSPAVILEHGMATTSESWAQVMVGVSLFTRVCAFDRAGRGTSEPARTPRTSADMVADLHALLAKAKVPAPYVLVGNSLGGANARLYAHEYADDVAGVVLVDSMHPDQFARFEKTLPPESPDEPDGLKWFRQSFTRDYKDPGKNPEGFDQLSSHEQIRKVTSLGDLPLTVLAAGMFLREIPEPRLASAMHGLWLELQRDLAQLSSRSTFLAVEDSGHVIQVDKPQVVIDAIKRQVEDWRSRRTPRT